MTDFDQTLYDEMYAMARSLLSRGTEITMIEKHLRQKSEDIILISVVIKEARKDYYLVLRKEGTVKILIGAVLIVLGFIITCLNFHAEKSVDFAMYGLTSAGLCFVFWGLYKFIG